jgi:hypothetical protein
VRRTPSRSSLKFFSHSGCRPARDSKKAPPLGCRIIQVTFSACFLVNVPQNGSEHICPKCPRHVPLLALRSRCTSKCGGSRRGTPVRNLAFRKCAKRSPNEAATYRDSKNPRSSGARLSPRRLHPAAIISRAEPSSWRLIGPVPVMIELNPRSFHDPNLITPFGPLPAGRAELIRYLV